MSATPRASVPTHIERLQELLTAALAGRSVEALSLLPTDEDPQGTQLPQRVLGAVLRAPTPLPQFDNSQMDGYALRVADVPESASDAAEAGAGEFALPLSATVAAGTTAPLLQPGTVAAVMTGAPIPAGADVIIPVEKTREGFAPLQQLDRGDRAHVTFDGLDPVDLKPGRFIRRAGSDVAREEILGEPGQLLTPALLAVLAACGFAEVPVLAPVRALVVATGAEVRPPGEPLGPGELYDANSVLIRSVLEAAGHRVRTVRISSDDPQDFARTFDSVLSKSRPQLVVTAGGISAGAYDVVRQVLTPRGINFGSLAQQPGGPQGWGLLEIPGTSAPVALIALPGNPVSCLVSLEILLRPALRSCDAACPPQRRAQVQLSEPVSSPAGIRQYRRVRLIQQDDGVSAELIGGPSSHLLGHLARADALLELTEEDTEVPAGEHRTALLLPGRDITGSQ